MFRQRWLLMLVTALWTSAACGGPTAPWGEAPDRIVLITIDTLRADHMSAFGHGSIRLPTA